MQALTVGLKMLARTCFRSLGLIIFILLWSFLHFFRHELLDISLFKIVKKNTQLNRPLHNYENDVSVSRIIEMTSRTSNQTRAPLPEVGRIAGASRHPRLEAKPTAARNANFLF